MYFNQVENKIGIFRNYEFSYYFFVRNLIKLIKIHYTGKRQQSGKVVGKRIMTPNEANNYLYNHLILNKPFVAARYGFTEHGIVNTFIMIQNGLRNGYSQTQLEDGKKNSGIFPKNQDAFKSFSTIYLEATKEVDMLVYWGSLIMEDYIIKHYAQNASLFPSRSLEPFEFEKPWTAALKGQKVLVIHPFEDTIQSQFKNRDKLFKNPDMLPEFELVTLKAVQSVADSDCKFNDWTQALNYMFDEAMKKDFDIALLGCGAYGFPLATKLKLAGKKVVHLGGMTQLLFGIKGARWEASRSDIVAMYNDYWVRTGLHNRPAGADKMVDGLAYW